MAKNGHNFSQKHVFFQQLHAQGMCFKHTKYLIILYFISLSKGTFVNPLVKVKSLSTLMVQSLVSLYLPTYTHRSYTLLLTTGQQTRLFRAYLTAVNITECVSSNKGLETTL